MATVATFGSCAQPGHGPAASATTFIAPHPYGWQYKRPAIISTTVRNAATKTPLSDMLTSCSSSKSLKLEFSSRLPLIRHNRTHSNIESVSRRMWPTSEVNDVVHLTKAERATLSWSYARLPKENGEPIKVPRLLNSLFCSPLQRPRNAGTVRTARAVCYLSNICVPGGVISPPVSIPSFYSSGCRIASVSLIPWRCLQDVCGINLV